MNYDADGVHKFDSILNTNHEWNAIFEIKLEIWEERDFYILLTQLISQRTDKTTMLKTMYCFNE